MLGYQKSILVFTMDIYRVSFIGHREVDDFFFVEEQVYKIVDDLISSKEFVEFYVGRNGEFDLLVASVIKRAKRDIWDRNSSLILVLPYEVSNIEDYENYYDEVMIPSELYQVHFKSAITRRNEWLIENSDMLVAYITRDYGGAAQCLKKAIQRGIEIKRIDRKSVEQDE